MIDIFNDLAIPSYLKTKIQFQEIITTINRNNIDEIFVFIKNNFKKEEEIDFTLRELCFISIIRYKEIETITELLKLVLKTYEGHESRFIKFAIETNANHLLYNMFNSEMIDLEAISEYQSIFTTQTKLFFEPFIKELNADDLEEEDFNDFDYETHNNNINNRWGKNSIGYMIKTDNLDQLEKYLCNNPEMQLEKEIKISEFDEMCLYKKKTMFSLSALYGSVKCFKYLFLSGANLTADVIKSSIIGGNLEIIKTYFNSGINDFKGCLDIAAQYRWMNVFEWILRQGFEDFTLNNAVFYRNYKVMIFAINVGLEDSSEHSTTTFEQAIAYEDLGSIKYLANHGFIKTSGKPIHEKIASLLKQGSYEIANVLIKNGAPIKGRIGNRGSTLLHIAAECGADDSIDFLLDRGMNIDKQDNYNQTALHIAAAKGLTPTVCMLIENEATIDAKDKLSLTPLLEAFKHNKIETAQLLIAKGADVNVCDINGWSPLFFAAEVGNELMIKLLISCKADLNHRDRDGNTAYHVAMTNNKQNVTELLKTDEIEEYESKSRKDTQQRSNKGRKNKKGKKIILYY